MVRHAASQSGVTTRVRASPRLKVSTHDNDIDDDATSAMEFKHCDDVIKA